MANIFMDDVALMSNEAKAHALERLDMLLSMSRDEMVATPGLTALSAVSDAARASIVACMKRMLAGGSGQMPQAERDMIITKISRMSRKELRASPISELITRDREAIIAHANAMSDDDLRGFL